MATVLISNKLIDDITRQVQSLKADEIRIKCGNNGIDADMSPHTGTLRLLERLIWPEGMHEWASKMPSPWKKVPNRVDIRVSYVDNEISKRVSVHCTDINHQTFAPPDFQTYRDHDITEEQLVEWAANPDYPEAQTIYDRFLTRKLASQLEAKWNKTESEVRDYFRACPSLNKALVLNPSMRLFVPQQYLNKLEEKAVVREKREMPTIDAAALAAQAVEVSLAKSIHGAIQ